MWCVQRSKQELTDISSFSLPSTVDGSTTYRIRSGDMFSTERLWRHSSIHHSSISDKHAAAGPWPMGDLYRAYIPWLNRLARSKRGKHM